MRTHFAMYCNECSPTSMTMKTTRCRRRRRRLLGQWRHRFVDIKLIITHGGVSHMSHVIRTTNVWHHESCSFTKSATLRLAAGATALVFLLTCSFDSLKSVLDFELINTLCAVSARGSNCASVHSPDVCVGQYFYANSELYTVGLLISSSPIPWAAYTHKWIDKGLRCIM